MRFLSRTSLLAFVLVLASSCGKKKDKGEGTKEDDKPLIALEGLSAVPASASAVIGLDVKSLQASPLIQRAIERMFASDPDLKVELEKVLGSCEIDVSKDIESALLALVPSAEGSDSLLVAKGNLGESAISTCLGRLLSESGGRLESASFEGRTLYHQVPAEGQGVWLSFGSDQSIVVSSGRPTLEKALGDGLKLSAKEASLAALLKRARGGGSLWAVAEVSEEIGRGLVVATQGRVQAPEALVASADLSTGLDVSLAALLPSERDASRLAQEAQSQLGAISLALQSHGIGPLVQAVEIKSKDRWTELHWSLSEAELAQVVGASFSALGTESETGVDKDAGSDENPAPTSDPKGEKQNGN